MDIKLVILFALTFLCGEAVMLMGFSANKTTESNYLEWKVIVSASPHRFYTNKYEIKFDIKLLDVNDTKFVDINENGNQKAFNFFDIGNLSVLVSKITYFIEIYTLFSWIKLWGLFIFSIKILQQP